MDISGINFDFIMSVGNSISNGSYSGGQAIKNHSNKENSVENINSNSHRPSNSESNSRSISNNQGIEQNIDGSKTVLSEQKEKDDIMFEEVQQSFESALNTAIYKAYFDKDDTGEVIIKIVDNEGSLLRKIPPDDLIKQFEDFEHNAPHNSNVHIVV